MARWGAVIFTLLALIVIAFQIGLAAGMPLGHLAMGGAFSGSLPPPMRMAAVVQALLFGSLIALVWRSVRTGKRRAMWAIAALMLISLILNLITPSAAERALWAPVAAGLFLSVVMVAKRRHPSV